MKGKKEISRANIYRALELVKQRQYKKFMNRKPDEPEIELNPFVIMNKAIRNCRPLMKLLNCTRGKRNLFKYLNI
jgi:ribosomal protein S7